MPAPMPGVRRSSSPLNAAAAAANSAAFGGTPVPSAGLSALARPQNLQVQNAGATPPQPGGLHTMGADTFTTIPAYTPPRTLGTDPNQRRSTNGGVLPAAPAPGADAPINSHEDWVNAVNRTGAYEAQGSWLFQKPNGDPNAQWASGAGTPVAGVDRRMWTGVSNPGAYEYGGKIGLAEQEAARYQGLANQGRAMQDTGEYERQGALNQYYNSLNNSDNARQQQMQGLGYLQNMAQGNGPSAAQAQMAQGLSQAREQQASIAANARGGGANLAAAQAAGANAASNLSLQGIQATGALRAQEQANAMSQYGQQAGALRSSDFGRAQLSQSGQQLAQAQQQFGAGQASQYEQYMNQVRAQQQGYQQAGEDSNLRQWAAQNNLSLAQAKASQDSQNQWIQAGTSAASAALVMAAMSDERAKEDVSDAGEDLDDAMSKLRPVNYKYKPGLGQDPGPQTGIMAQHLASSKAGAKVVFKGDDGLLRVKVPQAATLALAGLARLSERLRKLEAGNARK